MIENQLANSIKIARQKHFFAFKNQNHARNHENDRSEIWVEQKNYVEILIRPKKVYAQ